MKCEGLLEMGVRIGMDNVDGLLLLLDNYVRRVLLYNDVERELLNIGMGKYYLTLAWEGYH